MPKLYDHKDRVFEDKSQRAGSFTRWLNTVVPAGGSLMPVVSAPPRNPATPVPDFLLSLSDIQLRKHWVAIIADEAVSGNLSHQGLIRCLIVVRERLQLGLSGNGLGDQSSSCVQDVGRSLASLLNTVSFRMAR